MKGLNRRLELIAERTPMANAPEQKLSSYESNMRRMVWFVRDTKEGKMPHDVFIHFEGTKWRMSAKRIGNKWDYLVEEMTGASQETIEHSVVWKDCPLWAEEFSEMILSDIMLALI